MSAADAYCVLGSAAFWKGRELSRVSNTVRRINFGEGGGEAGRFEIGRERKKLRGEAKLTACTSPRHHFGSREISSPCVSNILFATCTRERGKPPSSAIMDSTSVHCHSRIFSRDRSSNARKVAPGTAG